jgi:lipoprotein-releasing system ATP-binding protein
MSNERLDILVIGHWSLQMGHETLDIRHSPTILRARAVRKVFDGEVKTEVLRGIDLSFRRGEFAAIIGASGSGKSTLLYLLGALDRPTEGSIEIAGQDVSRLNDAALARLRNESIGFVFQFHFLLPEFTATENVEIPMLTLGKPSRSAMRQRAQVLLERVGLGHRLNSYPSRMSGGEQQRVAIARALANAPQIVLCDEPTGNLDSRNSEQVYDLLREVNREQEQTIIVVTHDLTFAQRADRIVRLSDGAVVEDTSVVWEAT